MLLEILDEFFPEKTRKIASDDQPWISHRLKVLDRQCKRVLHKERKSEKWKVMRKLFKLEISTPVPKSYPPKNISEVLLNFDKIMEKLLSELIISDMKPNMDPSQYGNQTGISIQHYLINMIHRILTALDNNSRGDVFAVIANLIDWNNAFPRQCPKLGIESHLSQF